MLIVNQFTFPKSFAVSSRWRKKKINILYVVWILVGGLVNIPRAIQPSTCYFHWSRKVIFLFVLSNNFMKYLSCSFFSIFYWLNLLFLSFMTTKVFREMVIYIHTHIHHTYIYISISISIYIYSGISLWGDREQYITKRNNGKKYIKI